MSPLLYMRAIAERLSPLIFGKTAYERKSHTLVWGVGEQPPLFTSWFVWEPEWASPGLLDGKIVAHCMFSALFLGVPSRFGIR